MRKTVLYLLLFPLLLCTAGCQSSGGETGNSGLSAQGKMTTDVPGIQVCIEDLGTQEGTTVLNVLWRNESDYDLVYGEAYNIEKKAGILWISCAKQAQTAFNAIGYELAAGQAYTKSYRISDLFDVSSPGTYRFTADCYVYQNPEKSTKCTLAAEFTVGDSGMPKSSLPAESSDTPPAIGICTPDGSDTLRPAGYDWTCTLDNGTAVSTIADQVSRPLPENSTKKLFISTQHAQTVYAPVADGSTYEATNSLGYLIELDFPIPPSSVTYTCWQEDHWQESSVREETVVARDITTFYAKPGGYIYEIVATWDDTGTGCHGSGNYYVYLSDKENHVHTTALTAQTTDDPITGYCGNTQTTLYIGSNTYTFAFDHSVTLTDLLVNLDYDPNKVCRCMAQYKADTEFGKNYQIHLDNGFVRCEKGQADLTQEQIDTIANIIEWAETTYCQYAAVQISPSNP